MCHATSCGVCVISHLGCGTSFKEACLQRRCVCASCTGALALLALPAYVLRNTVWFLLEGKIVCLSFQSLLMRHCHIQEYMMLMEEDGLTFKGKRFPGLIWCLVNKEQKANLIKQLRQIQQRWDKKR